MDTNKLLRFIISEIGINNVEMVISEMRKELENPKELNNSSGDKAEMEEFFNGIMKGLKKSTTPDYPDSVFYRKNGKIYIEHDKKNGRAWLSYNLIWSVFYDHFGLNYKETQEFIQGVLGTHKELGGVTICLFAQAF